uniref:LITAF domain-containing protein n=1 Tax=Panagrellus redivivus TaxID=6233 RepID=A0A7E4VLV6_PANRE
MQVPSYREALDFPEFLAELLFGQAPPPPYLENVSVELPPPMYARQDHYGPPPYTEAVPTPFGYSSKQKGVIVALVLVFFCFGPIIVLIHAFVEGYMV